MRSLSFSYNCSRNRRHILKFSVVPHSPWTSRHSRIQVPRQGTRSQSWFHPPGHEPSLLSRAEVQHRWLWVSEYQALLIFQSLLCINSATLSRKARGTPKRKASQDRYPSSTAGGHFKNFASTALKLALATMATPELHFCGRDQKLCEFFQVLNFRRHLRP